MLVGRIVLEPGDCNTCTERIRLRILFFRTELSSAFLRNHDGEHKSEKGITELHDGQSVLSSFLIREHWQIIKPICHSPDEAGSPVDNP